MAAMGWKRPFDDPIPLPRGRKLVTLKEAARHVQKLPNVEPQLITTYFAEHERRGKFCPLRKSSNGAERCKLSPAKEQRGGRLRPD
jgi:hypothetical protein